MFTSPFFRRLFLPYLLLIGGAVLVIGLLSARSLSATYLDRTAQRLRDNAKLIEQQIVADLDPARRTELANRVKQIGQQIGGRVTLIADDGTVLADNEVEAAGMESHRFRQEVIDALTRGEGVSVRRSDTIHEDMLYLARQAEMPDGSKYLIRLGVHLSELNDRVAILNRNLLLTAALTVIGAGAIGYYFARRNSVPVVELTGFADAVARGDLTRRIARTSTEGEIGTLTVALNSMADSISGLLAQTNNDKAELLAILSSMSEGVIATDREQRIVVSNATAARLFGMDRPDGRLLWEVVRHASILQATTRVLESGEQQRFEVGPIIGRHLDVTVCPIRGVSRQVSGVVVVAHDTTESVRYQELRKEFVANASHELRTPLTAIKGFAETLRSWALDDPTKRQQYVATIEKHADQLTNLVNDLLDLSRMESRSDAPDVMPVDVSAIVRRAVEMLVPIADRKRQTVIVEVDPDIPEIEGIPNYLERAVANLFDNAIKYTPEVGRIVVRAFRRDDWVMIEVQDDGIGIPPGDLARVFERFYRVDRSRSREMGGTGLGLSIVKHIVQAHGGSVEVQSRIDEGSTFRIRVPVRASR